MLCTQCIKVTCTKYLEILTGLDWVGCIHSSKIFSCVQVVSDINLRRFWLKLYQLNICHIRYKHFDKFFIPPYFHKIPICDPLLILNRIWIAWYVKHFLLCGCLIHKFQQILMNELWGKLIWARIQLKWAQKTLLWQFLFSFPWDWQHPCAPAKKSPLFSYKASSISKYTVVVLFLYYLHIYVRNQKRRDIDTQSLKQYLALRWLISYHSFMICA